MKIYRIASYRDYDWSDIDWMKSDSFISRQMGVPLGMVGYARKNLAPPQLYNLIDSIDWSKSDELISKETGWDTRTVKRNRKIYAPETKEDYISIGYQPRGHSMWDTQLDNMFGLENE